jgi:hypothetical protein
MATQYEEPVLTVGDPVGTHEDLAPPEPPTGKHVRWPWLVAVLAAIALIVAGGVWWLLDSTVSQGDYDDVVAELEAARADVSAAEDDLEQSEQVRDELEGALSSRRDEITSQRSEILAYEEGAVAVWAVALLESGFEPDVASCVAETMVQEAGPATLEGFREFAAAGSEAVPSGELVGTFLGAMEKCGVPMDALAGLG